MQINLIAVGTRMPGWVDDGYRTYARRLPRECSLRLTEIPLGRRSKAQPVERAVNEEGKRMLAASAKHQHIIALDIKGQGWSTRDLAEQMRAWMQRGCGVSLLVGGPDGLDNECLARARQHWSLSSLTLPHPLVRVLLAEQLYRAWTLLSGHPYHRS